MYFLVLRITSGGFSIKSNVLLFFVLPWQASHADEVVTTTLDGQAGVPWCLLMIQMMPYTPYNQEKGHNKESGYLKAIQTVSFNSQVIRSNSIDFIQYKSEPHIHTKSHYQLHLGIPFNIYFNSLTFHSMSVKSVRFHSISSITLLCPIQYHQYSWVPWCFIQCHQ